MGRVCACSLRSRLVLFIFKTLILSKQDIEFFTPSLGEGEECSTPDEGGDRLCTGDPEFIHITLAPTGKKQLHSQNVREGLKKTENYPHFVDKGGEGGTVGQHVRITSQG